MPAELPLCPACDGVAVDPVPGWPLKKGEVNACRTCGLLFIHPQPPIEDLEAYYTDGGWLAKHPEPTDEKARRKTKRGAPAFLAVLDRFFPARAPERLSRVLDFGCGTGAWLNSFQDHGWETYGIEPSTSLAFNRHRRLAEVPSDPIFDLVIAYHVLEHLPRPLDTLKQLAGCLRPEGFCLLSVPRLDTLPEYKDHAYCLNPRNHIVAFTEACLRGLLSRAGLSTVGALHELDDVLSKGRPIRLRLLARKTDPPAPVPDPREAIRVLLAKLRPLEVET